tara:strand:- start:1500 stop:2384 length:885 start_codon:yes stop_codon:yes gene_type:complete
MKPYRTMVLRSKTNRKGTTKVVASSPTPDRYGDVVAADWNLESFERNPIVAWAHDYSLPPVGRVTSIRLEGSELVASIEWDNDSTNPLGQTVASQFKRGFLNAVSVGFTPGEQVERSKLSEDHPAFGKSGYLFTKNELQEISAVPIPAHRDAIAIRSNAKGATMNDTVNRHIMDVKDNGDSWTITFHKVAEEDDEYDDEEVDDEQMEYDDDDDEKMALDDEEETDDDDDDEQMAADDEDDDEDEDEDEEERSTGKAFKSAVRRALLDLIGSNPAILEQQNTTTDSVSQLFGIDK